MKRTLYIGSMLMLVAGVCVADHALVPSRGNGLELSTNQEGPIGGDTARRFQIIMDARALDGIPAGSRITGIRFRQDNFNATPWPSAGFVFADYELRISAAATTAATASTIYAANISGAQILVMDGALNIGANTFPGGGATGTTPEDFGPVLAFDTGYVYAGGSLCLDFNHSGTGLGSTRAFDATSDEANDFVAGLYAGTRNAVNGSLTTTPLIRFEYEPPTQVTRPESLATTEGVSGQNGALGGNGLRRFLYNIDVSALGIPSGSVIVGMAFRQNNASVAWPVDNFTMTDYEVRLGVGVATGSMSVTYANNYSIQTLVADGPFSVNSGAFAGDAADAGPEEFGTVIEFDTPYPYFGGNLSIDINHTGTGLASNAFMDATSGGDFASSGMRGLFSDVSRNAATGVLTNAPVTRFFYLPGPSPDLTGGVTKIFIADVSAGVEGNSNLNSLVQSGARSYMVVSAASQLDTIAPGSQFVGHAMRINAGSAAWPVGVANFASYHVQLSRSVNAPGALSTTFLNNVGTDAVDTYNAPLVVPAGAAESGTPTSPFTFSLGYRTPYTYTGGPLNMFVRHSGNGSLAGTMDAFSSASPLHGVAADALLASGDAAVTGSSTLVTVLRYDVDAAATIPLNAGTLSASSVSGLLNEFDYTIQTILHADQLRHIPAGSPIDSIWYRNAVSPTPPTSNGASTDVEVTVSSAANSIETMSTTFADNEGPDAVRVYDGGLALSISAFPTGGSLEFGRALRFQRAFIYKGGDLCVTVRHRGFSHDMIDSELGTDGKGRSVFQNSFSGASGFFLLGEATPSYPTMKLGYIPSVMTPNFLATAEGSNGLAMPASDTTAQVIIPASQLLPIDVGSAITGLSLRQSPSGGSLGFPATTTALTRFDVSIASAANGPLGASDTFANNIGPDEVIVRSGPLTVPAGAFPYSGDFHVNSENAWYVPFTRAYVYTGGDLVVTMRKSGSLSPVGAFFDMDGNGQSALGVTKHGTGNADALVADGTFGPMALRLAFTARAFCPWDLNNDGTVDDGDFVVFLAAYNLLDCADASMPFGCPADFTFDEFVNDDDFVEFLAAYNNLLCP